MTQDKVDMYLMTNQKYLPAERIVFLKQKLLEADESKFTLISAVELKDRPPCCWSPSSSAGWASTGSCWAIPAWVS